MGVQKNKKIKLNTVLFISIFIVAIIPVVMLSQVTIFFNTKNIADNYEDNAEVLLNIAGSTIEEDIEEYENIVNKVIEITEFEDSQAIKPSMEAVAKYNESVLNMYFVNELDGNVTFLFDSEIPEGIDIRDKDWYIETANNTEGILYDPVYEDSLTGKNITTIYKRIEKNGKLLGVIGIDVELSTLTNHLSHLKYGKSGDILLIQSDGYVIAHSDESKLHLENPLEYDTWTNILENTDGYEKIKYNSINYESYYKTINKFNWKVVLRTESNEISSVQKMQKNLIILFALIIIVIATLLSITISKKK